MLGNADSEGFRPFIVTTSWGKTSFEKRHAKLLGDPKTDLATNGNVVRCVWVGHVPFHPNPDMHSGTYAYISRGSGEQYVSTASELTNSSNAVILGVLPI